MVAPATSRRSSTERSSKSANCINTSFMRPEASAARIMPTTMSSKGAPQDCAAAHKDSPASTFSTKWARMAACRLSVACFRITERACIRGKPASMAVARSRTNAANSALFNEGPERDFFLFLLFDSLSTLVKSVTISPRAASRRSASERLFASMVPLLGAPSESAV